MVKLIKGALMKRVAALLTAIVLCQLLVSCDSAWPYKPVKFIAPEPPPPKHAFITKAALDSFCGTGNVTLLYTLSKLGVMTQTIYYVHLSDPDATPVKLKNQRDGKVGRRKARCRRPMESWWRIIFSPLLAIAPRTYKGLIRPLIRFRLPSPGATRIFIRTSRANCSLRMPIQPNCSTIFLSITSRATYMKQVDSSSGQVIDSIGKIASHPLYGGISRDGRYMCTGYADTYIYDRTDSSYHPIDAGLQTCNPSISTDSILTDRMMFLNFAGVQTLNNNPYGNASVGLHKAVFHCG